MTTPLATAMLADAPAVLYDCQETSGTVLTDISGNNRHGTINGGATVNDTTDPAAPAGTSKHIRLDGSDDYLAFAAATGAGRWFTPAASGFTFEAMVYSRTWSNWARIFDFANGTNTDDMYFASNNSGSMNLRGGGATSANITRWANNAWKHVAVTVTAAGAVTVYLDGAVYFTGTIGALVTQDRAFMYIGKSSYADPYLAASVSHVGVYNAVLTATQVANHSSAAPLSGPPTAAPGNVTAYGSGGVGYASWAATAQAQSYEYRINGGTPVAVSATTATIPGLTDGTTYTFEVRAVNILGTGPWSAPVSFTPGLVSFTDNFATDPITGGRVTLNGPGGVWTWENNRLHQQDSNTANGSRHLFMSSWPRLPVCDFEFDYNMLYDPGVRKHCGAFIQTVDGNTATGFRITHLDNAYVIEPFTNGAGLGTTTVTVTSVSNPDVVYGRWYRWRVRHDFTTGAGSLTIDGATVITWTSTSYPGTTTGRPGFHTYGSQFDIDNVAYGYGTGAPPAAPVGVRALTAPGAIAYSFDPIHEATSYEYRIDGGTATALTGAGHHGKIGGLTNGTAYAVQFRGVNATGAGPWSDPASVTPTQTPYEALVLSKSPVLFNRLDADQIADWMIDLGSNAVDWRVNHHAKMAQPALTTEVGRSSAAAPTNTRFPYSLGMIRVPAALTGASITAECWVTIPPGNLHGYFFTFGQAGGWAVGVGSAGAGNMDTDGRQLMMVQENVAWKPSGYTFPDDGVTTVTYHVAVVRGVGDAWLLYLNGNLVYSATWTPNAYSADVHSVAIGGPATSSSRALSVAAARVDNFAAYPAALTAASIKENYLTGIEQATAPAAVTNLAALGLDSAALVTWDTPSPQVVNRWEYRVNGGAPVATTSTRTMVPGLTNSTDALIEVRAVTTLGGPGPWTGVHVTPRVTYLWDDFERANVAPAAGALGSPVQGAAWTALSGTIGISGGRAYVTTAAENIYTVPGGSDIDVSAKRADAVANWGIVFRVKDANNLWLFNGHLYHRAAGTYVEVAKGGPGGTQAPAVVGDVWRIVAKDKRIRVYVNGALVINEEDAYYDATAVGVGLRMQAVGNLTEQILAQPPLATDFPERTGAAESLTDLVAAGSSQINQSHVYKGRDTKAADTGTVA